MRWAGRQGSTNVEDRRGQLPMGRMPALGCGGLLLVIVLSLVFKVDPREILGLLDQGQVSTSPEDAPPSAPPPDDELGRFASVVLKNTEERWGEIFAGAGSRYEQPRLVLFSEAVESACGYSTSATGPFYCPLDHKVYLDLSFFDELDRRFGASGDFAAAYVIAHEVGHHVQNLMGIAPGGDRSNADSVRLELQADCLAGVWGNHANRERDFIEPGDFEEGLRAASAIGDDRLQHLSRGRVQPESFTHGTSEQRASALKRGLASGEIGDCPL